MGQKVLSGCSKTPLLLKNRPQLAAHNKKNCEDHTRSNLARDTSVPSSQEDYISQPSGEIEDKVTKKLSKEFSRTESLF